MQESEKNQFREILSSKKVSSVYQPIVNLKTGEVVGYEALSRGPVGTNFYSPIALIEMATKLDLLWELELLFRQKALEGIKEMRGGQMLFLNVDPNVIKSPEYKTGMTQAFLKAYGADKIQIVFEITERTAITDYQAFQELLDNYRSQGYLIAIDDVGAGYSGLNTINQVRPNYIKIDMSLVRNIDKDTFKQSLLKAFVETSKSTHLKIIAEGIETKEELKTLILLGVDAGQGYYIQKPMAEICGISNEVNERIISYNKIANNLTHYSNEYHYVSNLIGCTPPIVYEPMTNCLTIKNHMGTHYENSVCICEKNRPVGLVMKSKLDGCLSGQYGYALFANRPISHIMNKNPLVVDCYTPISVVAKNAMGRCDQELYDDVIVTKADQIMGLVPMKKIIEYTLMYEKNNAKEHNPLTGLPGNPIINRVLTDIVDYNNNVLVAYIDINDFKVYNDVFGFEAGDEMIGFVAEILKKQIKDVFSFSSFVGHVGGDDFVVVISGDVSAYYNLCDRILESFECNKERFFNQTHLKENRIISDDRFGIQRSFPLTSLSIVGVFGDFSQMKSSKELTECLAKMKKEAKKRGSSVKLLQDLGAKNIAI